MGLLSGLLGGSKSTTAPSTVFGPQAQFLENQFFPQLTSLFGGFDPSQLAPGFNPTELAGQQAALGAGQQIGSQLFPQAQQGLSALFGGLDPTQAIQGAISPIFEQFRTSVAPAIRRASIGNQPGGGSRGALQTRAAGQDALRAAGDIASQIALQARGQGLQATQAGLGLIPSIAQLGLLPSQIQRQIGGEQRGLQTQQQLAPLSLMQLFQSLAGPPTVLGGGGSASSSPGLFGAATGLSLFPGGTSLFG